MAQKKWIQWIITSLTFATLAAGLGVLSAGCSSRNERERIANGRGADAKNKNAPLTGKDALGNPITHQQGDQATNSKIDQLLAQESSQAPGLEVTVLEEGSFDLVKKTVLIEKAENQNTTRVLIQADDRNLLEPVLETSENVKKDEVELSTLIGLYERIDIIRRGTIPDFKNPTAVNATFSAMKANVVPAPIDSDPGILSGLVTELKTDKDENDRTYKFANGVYTLSLGQNEMAVIRFQQKDTTLVIDIEWQKSGQNNHVILIYKKSTASALNQIFLKASAFNLWS